MAAFLQFDKHPNFHHHQRIRMNCIPKTVQMASVEGPASSDWHTGYMDYKSFPPSVVPAVSKNRLVSENSNLSI